MLYSSTSAFGGVYLWGGRLYRRSATGRINL